MKKAIRKVVSVASRNDNSTLFVCDDGSVWTGADGGEWTRLADVGSYASELPPGCVDECRLNWAASEECAAADDDAERCIRITHYCCLTAQHDGMCECRCGQESSVDLVLQESEREERAQQWAQQCAFEEKQRKMGQLAKRHALLIPCPFCHVAAGPCISRLSNRPIKSIHEKRVEAARKTAWKAGEA